MDQRIPGTHRSHLVINYSLHFTTEIHICCNTAVCTLAAKIAMDFGQNIIVYVFMPGFADATFFLF